MNLGFSCDIDYGNFFKAKNCNKFHIHNWAVLKCRGKPACNQHGFFYYCMASKFEIHFLSEKMFFSSSFQFILLIFS